jgi:hypothetical protein
MLMDYLILQTKHPHKLCITYTTFGRFLNANGRSFAYQLRGGVLYTRIESRTSMPKSARDPKQ